jgi:hypothetical protein
MVSQSKSKTPIRPPGRRDPDHLRQRPLRVVQVHQQPLGVADVKAPTGVAERPGVPNLKGGREVLARGAPAHRADHRLTGVDADEPAVRSDHLRHLQERDALPAPHVEDRVPGPQT